LFVEQGIDENYVKNDEDYVIKHHLHYTTRLAITKKRHNN